MSWSPVRDVSPSASISSMYSGVTPAFAISRIFESGYADLDSPEAEVAGAVEAAEGAPEVTTFTALAFRGFLTRTGGSWGSAAATSPEGWGTPKRDEPSVKATTSAPAPSTVASPREVRERA